VTSSSPIPAPPRLHDPLRWKERPSLRAACLLLGLVSALFFARLLVDSNSSLVKCQLRRITGFPCAFCGSTRALAALSYGNIPKACGFNPVISGGTIFTMGVCAVGVVRPRVYRAFSCFTRRMLRRKRGRIALLVFAALNWLYLLLAL